MTTRYEIGEKGNMYVEGRNEDGEFLWGYNFEARDVEWLKRQVAEMYTTKERIKNTYHDGRKVTVYIPTFMGSYIGRVEVCSIQRRGNVIKLDDFLKKELGIEDLKWK